MKVALRIVLGVVALIALVWFGGRCWLARSLPQREGTVTAPVSAPVEVTFDAKGVPQIWARTDADAWYAIGWLHASDRLFQMELVRRLARGELAEVFGDAAFETDAQQRKLGFARRADPAALTPVARLALERYVAGVNAWAAGTPVLPPEFVLLRFRPRPWTVEDCLAIAAYQTWFAHELTAADESYQKIVSVLGASGVALTHAGSPWSPPTVSRSAGSAALFDPPGAGALRVTAASNSWVLSPARSSTRAALHASDPHLDIDQAPGLWYLAGLHSDEGLDIVGVTYAGSPFVVMGHNADVAFSFTVAAVDLVDHFTDRPQRSIRETIKVKGEPAPRVLQVEEGSRGVMVDRTTSLRWAGFDFPASGIVDSAVRLQKARNFVEFRQAVTHFGALDANWVYSDRRGNIGYQLGAPVPVRNYDSYLRQPAGDPKIVWSGYRALEETPWTLNPPEGFLASCNNQIVGPSWPYEIPGFYDPYRIGRALSLLARSRTPRELGQMQLDLVSGIAVRWKGLAAGGARAAGFDAEAAALERWDGAMTSGSREAALFEFWWRSMGRAVFEDELGRGWEKGRTLLEEALSTQSPAIDDRRTPRVESAGDLAARAMREAHRLANGRTWGEACQLEVRHPLARVKMLDWWLGLNRGPFPASGDAGSLNANFNGYVGESQRFRTRVGASMRFVLDWADVDAFTLDAALGQSGNPLSSHYDDFLDLSRRGARWSVPFSRQRVFAARKSLLVFEPAAK